MARKTKVNFIAHPEILDMCHIQNKFLFDSFLDYLKSTDKANTTIEQYRNDLKIFFCWNYTDNNNKPFIEITKRDYTRFQGKALTDWEWSPKRIRRVKACISSLSNYIENILDEEEEFKNFRSVIKKIESPVNAPVREKTIYTPEELQSVLDMLVSDKKYEIACALALAMYSGRRKSELARFKVSYFDEKNVLFGTLYRTPEKVVTKGRGSKGKLLTLYVLKKEFDPYLKLWLEERERLGITSEWLFPKETNHNEHIDRYALDRWARLLTKLSNKDFYWHSMRHFATTQFCKSNIPNHIIKQIIGWDSLEMVDLYNDTALDDVLGDYFKEQEGGKLYDTEQSL